jgi:hypothetical protein
VISGCGVGAGSLPLVFHCCRYNTTGRGKDSTVSRRVIETVA